VTPALHHVQIGAPPGCEPAARPFYSELLGVWGNRIQLQR
jgi:hypothetical protein